MYDFDRTLDHRTDGSLRWKQPAGRADVIGMGTADLDYFCPPAVQEAFRRIVEENTYNYRAKPDSYYQAVLGWYRRMYGLDLAPEMLSAVPGTILAVYLALRVVTCPGASVIAQSPYFGPVKSAAEAAGCTFIPNPMRFDGERFVLDLADFEEKVRTHRPMAFVLVNPHNPTGRVFTRQELDGAARRGIIDHKVVALGGVSAQKMPQVHAWGFGGVALLGAVWEHCRTVDDAKRVLSGLSGQ